MPDAVFAEPRLAAIYDVVDGERDDLDAYVAVVDELGAKSVLDIGCGTGSLACRLAQRGTEVVALDPAAASLDVARRKAGAEHVRWIHGEVADLPELDVDLALMTGNVAQVFLADADWLDVLRAARSALRPGGWLVFEARDPDRRAWEGWTRSQTRRRFDLPDGEQVETWTDLVDVDLPYVSFRQTFCFSPDGAELTSESTLCFRPRDRIAADVRAAGFSLEDVRDAPDRPGLELVVFARADGGSA